jgi:nucleoside-diphosphate-sugar epimerase
MKIFVAGGTGAIGRPLIAELLAKGHALVALTRSAEKAQVLVEQGIEPAIADVFDADAVKAVVRRARPEVVIEQLTALPRTYTRESMSAAAAFNHRIRVEGGANVLAAAQAAGGAGVWSWLHIEDAAIATARAAEQGNPGVYLIANDQPLAVREWLPAFARWLKAPPPPQVAVEDALKASGADAIYYGTQMRGVSNSKAKRELSFQPRPLKWIVDHGRRN